MDESRKEFVALQKAWEELVESLSDKYCAFCGKSYPPTDDDSVMQEHAEACKAHPMHALKEERDALRELVRELLAASNDWHRRVDGGQRWSFAITKAEAMLKGGE